MTELHPSPSPTTVTVTAPTPPPPPPSPSPPPTLALAPTPKPAGRWRLLRWAAWPVYFTLLARWTYENGLAYTEDLVFLWLIGALLAAAVHGGEGWRRTLLVLRDWVPVMAVVWTYSLLRGYGAHTPWLPHLRPQLAFDTALGFGQTWTVRLQHALYTPGAAHWYDYAAVTVYMSHFFMVFVLLAVLWRRNHARFRHLLGCYLAVTYAGFLTYVLYPAVPPWMAGAQGDTAPVTRIVGDVLAQAELPRAASVFEDGSRFANDVAAMPSLHAAYPMLIALFFWPTATRRVRVLLAAYPLAMAFTLVYGAEHFVIDILVGWVYAVVIHRGVTRLVRRRAAGRALRAVPTVQHRKVLSAPR
ncbi:phosphatase PAP2 family protein [Kitasatospora sp. NBC_00070]|uniref:phosphatase PAP2 family protein n=1 Tax=Kitasatospora sp. NBC_00070 TaxID=2975962 RepID=UPI0032498CA8